MVNHTNPKGSTNIAAHTSKQPFQPHQHNIFPRRLATLLPPLVLPPPASPPPLPGPSEWKRRVTRSDKVGEMEKRGKCHHSHLNQDRCKDYECLAAPAYSSASGVGSSGDGGVPWPWPNREDVPAQRLGGAQVVFHFHVSFKEILYTNISIM